MKRGVPSPSLTERDAALYIAVSQHTLRAWRRQGRGPVYLKLGRSIRYTVADLSQYLLEHRVEPGSAPDTPICYTVLEEAEEPAAAAGKRGSNNSPEGHGARPWRWSREASGPSQPHSVSAAHPPGAPRG